jgi:multidrug transporter EmrE-like cation transporter
MLVNVVSMLIFLACLSAGQLLFKFAASHLTAGTVPYALFFDPIFYLALALYGGSTVLWIWILTRMQLSIAYPWVASTMIIVPLFAYWVFGESLSPRFWMGCSLIVAGILLINVGA